MSKSEKITQFVIVICIAAIITAVGNVMDGKLDEFIIEYLNNKLKNND